LSCFPAQNVSGEAGEEREGVKLKRAGESRDQIFEVSSLDDFAKQMNAYAQLNYPEKATHFRVNKNGQAIEEVATNGGVVAIYLPYFEPDPDPRKARMEPIWNGNPSN
jgi:hypothetical protein